MSTDTLRVESSSRAMRRFSASWIAVIVVYAVAVFAIDDARWTTRLLVVVLIVGQIPLAVMKFAYAEVTEDGLELDVRVRRRQIPWGRLERLELGDGAVRPPRVVLTDGSEVKSIALGGFVTWPEPDPALIERLQRAADAHGFILTAQ